MVRIWLHDKTRLSSLVAREETCDDRRQGTVVATSRGDTQWRQDRAALRRRWRCRASIPSRRRNVDAVSGSRQDQRVIRSSGKAICGFRIQTEGTKVLIETPDQVFAEYMTHTRAAGTGRIVHHLFAGRLVAEKGRIKLLRESLNVLAAVQALNPKGAAGLPPHLPRSSPFPPTTSARGTAFGWLR